MVLKSLICSDPTILRSCDPPDPPDPPEQDGHPVPGDPAAAGRREEGGREGGLDHGMVEVMKEVMVAWCHVE